MKLAIFGLTLVTIACAQYTEYSTPLESFSENPSPSIEYLAPVEHEETVLADDGYQYKTIRRLRHRNRRDVSELASAEYLPPHQEHHFTEYYEPAISYSAPQQETVIEYAEPTTSYSAPVEQEQTVLAGDGYRYKTVRRFRHRNRRDVSELSSAEYLPPHQQFSSEYSEPSTSYLAPQQETVIEYTEPTTSYLAPVQQEETVLAEDGYRYKTVLRFRNRNRRDVSELNSAEYLPPHQELLSGYTEPATSYFAPVEQHETVLADDGYRYKTVRKFKVYRQ